MCQARERCDRVIAFDFALLLVEWFFAKKLEPVSERGDFATVEESRLLPPHPSPGPGEGKKVSKRRKKESWQVTVRELSVMFVKAISEKARPWPVIPVAN